MSDIIKQQTINEVLSMIKKIESILEIHKEYLRGGCEEFIMCSCYAIGALMCFMSDDWPFETQKLIEMHRKETYAS